MAKLVLIVHDKGDTMQITGGTIQPDDFKADETVLVMPFKDRPLYDKIINLLKTAKVEYQKPLHGKLMEEDLMITKYNPLDVYRWNTLTKGRNYITSRLPATSFFDFFDFINSNNVLLNAGFIITDENRTKKYLEIVETGDDKLIDALDDFLTAKDNIFTASGFYKTWRQFEKNIEMADSQAEMDNLYKDFVNYFE